MEEKSTAPLSKKQLEKRARVQAKQQKRQERARKKRAARGQQRGHIHSALQAIGATWEKQGTAFLDGGQRYYKVLWYGEEHRFRKPGDILRWAKAQTRTPRKSDYAEMEIARLIEQARREMEAENDN